MALASHSLHLAPNLGGDLDSRYPTGGKPPVQQATLDYDRAAFQAANYQLSARVGSGALSFNYRQFLTGTSAATAILSVNAITGTLTNWVFDGTDNNLTNPNIVAGSGTLQVTASNGVNTITFPIQAWALTSTLNTVQYDAGHWMMNNHPVNAGEAGKGLSSSPVLGEINDINGTVCVGYKLSIAWSAIDKGSGVYDFSFIDAVIAKLQTAYDRPYKVFIQIEYGAFNSVSPGSNGGTAFIPDYIQHNVATYGQAGQRVGGVVTNFSGISGFWGGDGNGNTYAPQFFRSSIADAYIAFINAMGTKYNNNPAVSGVSFRENSFCVGALANNSCPGYSNSGFDTQLRRIAQAMKTAFSNKLCGFQNTFYQGGGTPKRGETYCQEFTTFLYSIGMVLDTADTVGHTKTITNGGSWGMAGFLGIQVTGSAAAVTDMRKLGYRCMAEVEGPDYTPYTLADLWQALRDDVQASIIFWCRRVDTNVPSNVQWANLKGFLAANPIPAANLAYSSNLS